MVQHADSGNYAITARGFNDYATGNRTGNRILVLIDGRSVYTVLHGGVFWHENQVMLEDIERIEVISGPGGTLWGANAVNGVINVITRDSKDTQGGLANARYGTLDRTVNARYGAKIGENYTFRVYGQGYDYGPNRSPSDGSFRDGYHGVQTGFRADMAGGGDSATVHGDIYRTPLDQDGQFNGGNILGRFSHTFDQGSTAELQAYFDRKERRTPGATDSSDTYDIEAQHSFSPRADHDIVWGGGHRVYDKEFIGSSLVFYGPKDTSHLSSLFAQDTISLLESLKLTLGMKAEYSTYAGLQYLPNARLGWDVSDTTFLWTGVSRAVRNPSRAERESVILGTLVASPDFGPEEVIAYEIGYRGRPIANTTASVTLYYNQYDDLRSVERLGTAATPFIQANRLEADTYGVEAWGDHAILPWWRLSAGINIFGKDVVREAGSTDTTFLSEGNDPDFTYSLRSRMDLSEDTELDVGLRKVDSLPRLHVDRYLALDMRLAHRVASNLELSLSGFNLLESRHQETGSTGIPVEVPRSVIAGVRWTF